MPEISYASVIIAAVAAMILGGVWYGPLFGKLWMQGQGFDAGDKERMKKGMGAAYLQMFIGALLTAYVLAHVLWAYSLAMPEVVGFAAGLQSGFWLWLGFILPVKYGDKLWNGKKFKYVSIDLGYYLVNLLIMGAIIATW